MPVKIIQKPSTDESDDGEEKVIDLTYNRGKPTETVMYAKLVQTIPPRPPLPLPDHVTFKGLPAFIERSVRIDDQAWQRKLTDYYQADTPELRKRQKEPGYNPGFQNAYEILGWRIQEVGSWQPPNDARTNSPSSLRRVVVVTPIKRETPEKPK